jgi:EAL domain-containing protein (putative c-di-GMP-specific phosphodiesterase class I)
MAREAIDRTAVRVQPHGTRETTAEFAADAELVELLCTQGVDHAQGFRVGRPEPLDVALLAAR